MRTPRPYQVEAEEATVRTFTAGANRALVVMATGLGKTYTAARLIRWWMETQGTRVLFLAHLTEAVLQAKEKDVQRELVGTSISVGIRTGELRENLDADVVFATFQSIANDLEVWHWPEEYGLIIVDEAHHGQAASFNKVIQFFKPQLLFGMTATPDRMDGQDIREIFGHEIFIYDLAEALADGRWLSQVDYHLMVDDINREALKDLKKRLDEGDRNITRDQIDRTVFIRERTERIAEIVLKKQDGKRRTAIFCSSIDHIKHVSKFFPGALAYHSGNDSDMNRQILQDFRDGKFLTLLAVDMLNEAVDIPELQLIVFLRATGSRTIWKQQLGRGLRKHGDDDTVTVLDFAGNSKRIQMIAEFSNLITGYSRPEGMETECGWKVNFQTEILDLIEVLNRLKTTLYPTWEEAAQATRELGIKKREEYTDRYQEDPRLPSSPAVQYPDVWAQNHKWRGFLRAEKPAEFYATWEEASQAARVLGIQLQKEYRTKYQADPKLPSEPDVEYCDVWDANGRWSGFLGTGRKSSPKKWKSRPRAVCYQSWEEASKAAQVLGITTKEGYPEQYRKDDKLPGDPAKVYENVWNAKGNWIGFLGTGKPSLRTDTYKTYEQAATVAQTHKFVGKIDYQQRHQSVDPKLPSDPNVKYKAVFKAKGGWPGYLGKKVINFYKTWAEAAVATRRLKISNSGEYRDLYEKDPRLPSNPKKIYASVWEANGGWPGFTGTSS